MISTFVVWKKVEKPGSSIVGGEKAALKGASNGEQKVMLDIYTTRSEMTKRTPPRQRRAGLIRN